jgi:hypothetical protein
MTKTVTNIDCPKEWDSDNDYDSHRPLLWLSLKNTVGNVREFGMGYGSTLLMDKMCESQNRAFNSEETNAEWVEKVYKSYNKWWGNLMCIMDDYSDLELEPHGLLFVDCAPGEERKKVIEINKDICDVIVVHDTELGADYVYHMSEVLSTFKYRLDYQPEGKPHTSCISNIINVCSWV